LAVAILLAGCPLLKARQVVQNVPAVPGEGSAPSVGPTAPASEAGATPAANAGPGADLSRKRAALKSYAMTVIVDGKPTLKQYVKFENGKLVRMKTDLGGQGGWMYLMADQGVSYIYDAKRKTAMKMQGGGEEAKKKMESLPGAPEVPDPQELAKASAKWRTETVDGVECWVIETAVAGRGSQVWLDKKYGLVRQMQAGDKVMKHQYEKINAVPDSEFELPPGTKIVDLAKGLPGTPNMPHLPKP
jgi:hypothetical protein